MDEVKPAIDDCGDIRAVPAAVDAIVRDKDEVSDFRHKHPLPRWSPLCWVLSCWLL